MVELVIVGVVAGFLAGISPCILPVLPVVLVAGAEPVENTEPAPGGPARRRASLGRPLAVIAGLVLSFSFIVLAGSTALSLLHLPQDFLRNAGIVVLIVVGLGYLIPSLGTLLERPFARLGTRRPGTGAGGFVLGLALGVLYVPCAGPILAAITVIGATHRVGLNAVILTAAFAAGTAVPLLAIAVAGNQITGRVGAIRRHAPQVRRAGGAVLIVFAVAIAFNAFAGLQRYVPGYTSAFQGSAKVRKQLNALTGAPHTSLTSCNPNATGLVDCGRAPNFTGITAWLNTPGGNPLSIGCAARQGGAGRLLDLFVHQLPADTAPRRGLVLAGTPGTASSSWACTLPSSRSSTSSPTCGRRPRRSACTTRSPSTTTTPPGTPTTTSTGPPTT